MCGDINPVVPGANFRMKIQNTISQCSGNCRCFFMHLISVPAFIAYIGNYEIIVVGKARQKQLG